MPRPRMVPVYRYKSLWSMPDYIPEWGTRDAIANLDGCVLIARSERLVRTSALDADGFLPLGVTPDDLQTAAREG